MTVRGYVGPAQHHVEEPMRVRLHAFVEIMIGSQTRGGASALESLMYQVRIEDLHADRHNAIMTAPAQVRNPWPNRIVLGPARLKRRVLHDLADASSTSGFDGKVFLLVCRSRRGLLQQHVQEKRNKREYGNK